MNKLISALTAVLALLAGCANKPYSPSPSPSYSASYSDTRAPWKKDPAAWEPGAWESVVPGALEYRIIPLRRFDNPGPGIPIHDGWWLDGVYVQVRNVGSDLLTFNIVVDPRGPVTYPIVRGGDIRQDFNYFVQDLAPGSQRSVADGFMEGLGPKTVHVKVDHIVSRPLSGSPVEGLD